jgi:hypothetical protein
VNTAKVIHINKIFITNINLYYQGQRNMNRLFETYEAQASSLRELNLKQAFMQKLIDIDSKAENNAQKTRYEMSKENLKENISVFAANAQLIKQLTDEIEKGNSRSR